MPRAQCARAACRPGTPPTLGDAERDRRKGGGVAHLLVGRRARRPHGLRGERDPRRWSCERGGIWRLPRVRAHARRGTGGRVQEAMKGEVDPDRPSLQSGGRAAEVGSASLEHLPIRMFTGGTRIVVGSWFGRTLVGGPTPRAAHSTKTCPPPRLNSRAWPSSRPAATLARSAWPSWMPPLT